MCMVFSMSYTSITLSSVLFLWWTSTSLSVTTLQEKFYFHFKSRNFNYKRTVLPHPEAAVSIPNEIFGEKSEILYTQKYPVHDLKHTLSSNSSTFTVSTVTNILVTGFINASRNSLPTLLVMFGTELYW